MRARLLQLVLLLCLPMCAFGQGNSLGMSYVETRDGLFIYFDPLAYLVPHAARTFTNSMEWQRRTFGWTPSEATTVLLKDFSDYMTASAIGTPRNLLALDIAPMSHAFETYPAGERMFTTMNHELVHISQNDANAAQERWWRRAFFGKVGARADTPETLLYTYLTVPRFIAPRWYQEGSAVFMETWMAGGFGRAQGGYDEMVFRAMVRDNAQFYDPLGLVARGTLIDFQTMANAYLYGTRFMTWLAYTYSPEKVVDWLRRDEGSHRYYADNFQHVFGMPLERAWADWIAFERDFQRRNLAEVRTNPVTPLQTIATTAVGSISRMAYDEARGKLYAAFRYPGFIEHVGAIDIRNGALSRLADIKRAMHYRVSSFAYDPKSGTAFYTNDNIFAFRDLMAVNVDTGEERTLLRDARIGDVAFNPVDRSLYGVRHDNGLAALVRIPYPYESYVILHTFPYESVPYDLDVSPDGRLLSASMTEVNADQYLRVWQIEKLLAGDVKPMSEFRFGQSIPESFTFSHDSRYLYGSSYYTGVSNIFRYEVATGDVVAVSNAETGLFRPVELSDGRLLVLTFTGSGFVPAIMQPKPIDDVSAIKFLGAELVAKHAILTTWQVRPPSAVDYEAQVVRQGPYDPWRHVSLTNAYPTLQGYKNSAGIGYRANFQDPIAFVRGDATVAYTPTGHLKGTERAHVDLHGEYLGWHGELAWNKSDFYDLFGPTKRSRKGYAVKGGYDHLFIYDEPRRLDLLTDIAWYGSIDTLPQAQNVTVPFSHLATIDVVLKYTDVRRSLGAVEDEKGVVWSVSARGNAASGEFIPQVRGILDVGVPLPYAHSSVWLRTAAGASRGVPGNPLANFYFGAFGNNYVDQGAIKRYREWYSLPGFGIDEISAQRFIREMVEVNLPPVVFESVGTPAFYLTWLRPAVFAAGLWTGRTDASQRREYGSIGAQADLRFTVLHWYEMTLSVGYAAGFRGSSRAGNEWMISLKIL